MKKQFDLFILTFLALFFYSCGKLMTSIKNKNSFDILTILALVMLIVILYRTN